MGLGLKWWQFVTSWIILSRSLSLSLCVGWFPHYGIKEHLVQCSHSTPALKVTGEIIHCCFIIPKMHLCVNLHHVYVCDGTWYMDVKSTGVGRGGRLIWIEWRRTREQK